MRKPAWGLRLSWQGQKESNSQHTVLEDCQKTLINSLVDTFSNFVGYVFGYVSILFCSFAGIGL